MELKIYDKAKWHTEDAAHPIPKVIVHSYFKTIFDWLNYKNMLTNDGIEALGEYDSLNSDMLTQEGNLFFGQYYNELSQIMHTASEKEIIITLDNLYNNFQNFVT
ncbi:MAG: hypothetical protein FWC79_02510 [Oscillospiraceae bacterium]|nr:hypothetical protein [Oscillospiraceae bacterium]